MIHTYEDYQDALFCVDAVNTLTCVNVDCHVCLEHEETLGDIDNFEEEYAILADRAVDGGAHYVIHRLGGKLPSGVFYGPGLIQLMHDSF